MSEEMELRPIIKGFHVGVVGPDPWTVFAINIPITDLLRARGIIEEFKAWLEEKDREWVERAKEGFLGYKLKRAELKARSRATIVHVGRGKVARMYLSIIVAPQVLILYPSYAKTKFYDWLKQNCLVLRSRPESIYIITESKATEMAKVLNEVNKMIDEANRLYAEFYEEAREYLKELMQKYGMEAAIPEEPRRMHPLVVMLTPVEITRELLDFWRLKNPDIAEMLENTVKDYIKRALNYIIENVEPIIKPIMEGKSVKPGAARKKIEKIRQIISEVGLEEYLVALLNEAEQAITNPEEFMLKYKDYNDWRNNIERLVSL